MSGRFLDGARAAEFWAAVKGYVDEHSGSGRSDGNPIGTVISFMGKTAPKNYLICDGAEYRVSEYPDLAAFFQEQFGAANHFGGDGTEMFSVPDMRNLFLRGFHGDAPESLSGELGEKQEGTLFNYVYLDPQFRITTNTNTPGAGAYNVENAGTSRSGYVVETEKVSRAGDYWANFNARPTNMAVLFCIKTTD